VATEEALYYEIDRTAQMSVAGYTKKGVELLDNPNGFFMMVEGGKVDCGPAMPTTPQQPCAT